MPGLCLQDMASACNAVLYGADVAGTSPAVTSVGIDSRKVCAGQLFVALRGARVDGHQFLGAAKSAGAVGAVVETLQTIDLPQMLVADAAAALAAMASFNRGLYTGTVIAITGSSGKTTCKNMLAAILAESSTVHATRGNLNNELGVPLTLLDLDHTQQFAIVEMGAAKAGDIAYLARLARPQVGLVTNISEAHLGGFGSLQVTAQTKAELYAALPDGGIAVLNRDEPFFNSWQAALLASERDLRICTFSLRDVETESSEESESKSSEHNGDESSADIVARDISSGPRGIAFTATGCAQFSGWELRVRMPLLGQHNIANALASIAIAKVLQVDDASIANGLAVLGAAGGRLQPRAGKNALLLLDDTYNANPAAMRAAIDTLAGLADFAKPSADSAASTSATDPARPRVVEPMKVAPMKAAPIKIVALGDMAELGANAAQLHRDVGAYAAHCGIDYLFASGAHAEDYVAGFSAATGSADKNSGAVTAACFASYEALAARLLEPSLHGATVLLKASRSAALERLVALLANDQQTESPSAC